MKTSWLKLSPSGVATLEFCPRSYTWRYILLKGRPGPQDARRVLGSLYHAGAAAIDQVRPVEPALDGVLKSIRTSPTYLVADSPMLDKLRGDALAVLSKYPAYVAKLPTTWKTLMIEEPLEVNFKEQFTLVCVPDKVVRDLGTGALWVIERKTTSRNDSGWLRQWRLNFQTTAEVLAVEAHFREPVAGVYIEQVVITRRRNKSVVGLQALANVTYHTPKPVQKSDHIKAEGRAYLKAKVRELRWRARTDSMWVPRYGSCKGCDYEDICAGRVQANDVLVTVPRHKLKAPAKT